VSTVSAAREFVALDIELASSHQVKQIAGVKVLPEGGTELFALWIQAHPLALRAHQNAAPGAFMENYDTLQEAVDRLLQLTGSLPWVVFEAATGYDGLVAACGDGGLEEGLGAEVWEARELACYVLAEEGGSPFVALGRSLGLPWAEGTDFPRGMAFASALALLFGRLYERLLAYPLALVRGVAELLGRSHHPLAGVWQRAVRDRATEECSESVADVLRSHLQALSPPTGEGEEAPSPPKPLDVDLIRSHFEPGGAIARHHREYEHRPGQVAMAVAVAQAFNQEQLLLVEAGTGTGKSLAYLVPSLYWATTTGQKVVVSTNTKNLQDQLFTKDLPFLREALGLKFRAERVKGRNNYLCLDKLLQAWEEAAFIGSEEQRIFLAYLLCWARSTPSGDLDEIHAWMLRKYPRLKASLATVASDSETCLSSARRNHACYATLARRRALAADLLIINHALALANAVTQVLPPFEHIVFDEAHNLEDIATNAFGREVSQRDLAAEVRALRGSGREWGLLQRVRRTVEKLAPEQAEPFQKRLHALDDLLSRLEECLDEFTRQLGRTGRYPVQPLTPPQRMRLRADWWDQPGAQALAPVYENLQTLLRELIGQLTHLTRELIGQAEALPGGERLLMEAEGSRNRWIEIADSLASILKLEDPASVYSLELGWHPQQLQWRLQAAPINPGEALAAQVYRSMKTVILTSATLTINHRFDYFRHRLGLDEVSSRLQELCVPSSFDYRHQVLLAVPSDMPLPGDPQFDQVLAAMLRELTTLIQGRTLVLFTSYASLERVFHALKEALEEAGIEILAQGISGSRHYIAERFRQNTASVLLGTKSFWEGIDVPGETLQCVVIAKLPFAVPDDPIVQARCEYLENQGLDSRLTYYEPLAIIQFKQGFGRLIRSATDHGAVLVFDRRLLIRPYGRRFMDSVPGYTFLNAPWYEIIARTRGWLMGSDTRPAYQNP
jgi:predicted DnaQ family exonuclease/DinG family helicase